MNSWGLIVTQTKSHFIYMTKVNCADVTLCNTNIHPFSPTDSEKLLYRNSYRCWVSFQSFCCRESKQNFSSSSIRKQMDDAASSVQAVAFSPIWLLRFTDRQWTPGFLHLQRSSVWIRFMLKSFSLRSSPRMNSSWGSAFISFTGGRS